MWALETADFQSILRRSLYDERSEKKITLVNAAQKIQCAVRLFLARQAVKRIIGRRFIKIYDTVTREYVYKDKSTHRIQISKPSLLGCIDLPSPRSLVAPDHYDPHYNSRNSDCHAIVITVSSFIHKDVIPDLPIETIAEHETLKDILSHDFICKVPPDKVISLLNPRCNDFQAAFLHLRKVCRMNDSLLVYICTHIGTRLNVGRNKDENGYFLMHDTNWRSAKEIAQSSISISAICQLLNKILCKSKTILLNCVHQGRQPFKLFGAQELYPPSDYFSRLSDGANCLVIGSCMIGAPISDIINHTHTPSVLSQSTDQFRSGAVNVATLGRKYSLTSWMTSAIKISPAHKNQPEIYNDNGNSRLTRILNPRNSNLRKLLFPNIKMLRNGDSKIGVNNGCDITDGDGLEAGMKFLKLNKSMDISKNSMVNSPDPVRFPPLLSLSYSAKEKIYLQYFDDWKVPITSDLTPIIKPAQPRVSWSRDNIKADCGSDYNFNLPTDQENFRYKRKNFFWRFQAVLRSVSNYIRKQQLERRTSPSQVGLLCNRGTVFGRAVVAALRGGASSPLSSTVTAEMLFTSIVKHMKQYLCESVHQFDYQNNCENYEVPDLNESISSSGDLENGNCFQFQIIGKDDCSQMTANNEGSTSYLYDKYGNKKTTADTMTINQNPIMVVPRIPRSGISFRICGTHHTRQLSSVSVMNIVTYSCSPPPAPKKPEIVSIGLTNVTLKWSESPFSGVHATSYRLQFRNDSRNFKQWTPVPNLGEINRKCHRVVNLTKGMTYQFRVSAGNNGGWGEESEPSDDVCPGSGYGRVAGKMTSSGSIFISTALRRSRLSKGGPLAILDHLELFPMTRDEHVWGLARLRSMAQSASGYKKETLQTRVAVAAIYSLLTFKNDPEMAGVGLSLLGWTLKGPGVGHVMQLVVQNSIIKIAVDYIIRHRTNCDVISAVTLLRCNMPPGCIPRLEDVIVEKNISFPQKNAI